MIIDYHAHILPADPANDRTLLRIRSYGWSGNWAVGIFGSGGINHFVIDSDIDQVVFTALKSGAAEALKSTPQNVLQSGSSELRIRISVAGALFETEVAGDVIGYGPCCRSATGMGTAQGIVIWT